jgi:hypothetical protein
MNPAKILYVPYSSKDLYVRVVLFEKTMFKEESGPTFCGYLNDWPVYSNFYLIRGGKIVFENNSNYKYISANFKPELILIDSTIIESLLAVIDSIESLAPLNYE